MTAAASPPLTPVASRMRRLPFELPDFTRWMWVSERAREVWAPRCRQAALAWQRTEWLSVLQGVRRNAVILLPARQFPEQQQEWNACELSCQVLERIASPGQRAGEVLECLVGTAAHLTAFMAALDREEGPGVSACLGMPRCCYEFHEELATGEGLMDTTWPMAWATPGCRREASQLEVAGPWVNNLLFRWLGVRAVPHLPCSFACEPSAELGRRMIELAGSAGLEQEAAWIGEMLSWPAEWSALHGIAEVRTPVVKIVTRTDATAECYVVRRAGTRYPAEGAQGLAFPFRAPSRRARREGPESTGRLVPLPMLPTTGRDPDGEPIESPFVSIL